MVINKDFRQFIDIITNKQRNDKSLLLINRIKDYKRKEQTKEVVDTGSVDTGSVVDVGNDFVVDKSSDVEETNVVQDNDTKLPNNKVITDYELNTKKEISYSYNEKGQIVKTTKEYKIVKSSKTVSKAVSERRKWAKFGVSAGLPPGPDSSSTSFVCDEVFFERIYPDNVKDDVEDTLGGVNIFGGTKKMLECKYCKGAHWSVKCPNRSLVKEESSQGIGKGSGKFIPSRLRNGGGSEINSDKNLNTIRVSNITENATEQDLRDLFNGFGYIKRIHYKTGKGYSFITFDNLNGCKEAIKKVDRHPYDHLILSVEMASGK